MATMTPNTDKTERNQAGNGGPQGQQGGSQAQQGGSEQGPAAKAASLAASAATRQVEKARERVVDRVAQQREQISSRVRSLSRALRGAGEMLEENDIAGHALHYASDKVERVAGYVSDLSPEGVVDDLRGVARTNPLWFFGGAFTLGLALGRFARSTGDGVAQRLEGEQSDEQSGAARGPQSSSARSQQPRGQQAGSASGQERRREPARSREPQP